MYAFLQKELGHIGRFQKGTNNVLRFIISDIEGIKTIIKLVHGKLRTPKNIRFNLLIDFMNAPRQQPQHLVGASFYLSGESTIHHPQFLMGQRSSQKLVVTSASVDMGV